MCLLKGTCPAEIPDDFPTVPDDFEVRLFAREPMVRNPCAITFDAAGRLMVGMGPQYRRPTPETRGDAVFILLDRDGDGVADQRKQFAGGLNSIQGMAWRGNELWVANAPDLTVLRDTDGDDEADEYLRLYTDLGNIEHGLHGLNWAPDGKLYMSKGNSKGLNQSPDRIAPRAFRELWGMKAPEGTPDFPTPVLFDKDSYRNAFHDPDDDWGLNGGVLRCNPDGSGLEIVARGCRNPWDITFDSSFNWLGTDNDQNLGDKIFSPFFSANFGWGHPWSYDWRGDDHLPSAPSAGPLFEGSGTGIVFCDVDGYPDAYNGVYLINDWLKRVIYIYRPDWKGALMRPMDEALGWMASAGSGRSMKTSEGRSFDPVDIEIGPDGAIYVSSWGRQYGAVHDSGKMVNEGRIYKLWPSAFKPSVSTVNKLVSNEDRSIDALIADLDSRLPARRMDAQDELVRRGRGVVDALKQALDGTDKRRASETWLLWTLGRIGLRERDLDSFFVEQWKRGFNRRLQALRIVAFQARERGAREVPEFVGSGLLEENARLRHESVLALHQSGDTRWKSGLLALLGNEKDRLVYYSAWQAMRDLFSTPEKKAMLRHEHASLRRAALLSLLEDDVLADEEIQTMTKDQDPMTSFLAEKRLSGRAMPVIKGPAISQSSALASVSERSGDPTPFVLQVLENLEPSTGRPSQQALLLPGVAAYIDRAYRIQEIPESLIGQTFLQGANNDAEDSESPRMSFELMFPSTVYIADDLRGTQLPAWLERDFEATELYLRTDDARHRLYKAQLPAGKVSLGPNRVIDEAKAAYIVIIEPHYLQSQTDAYAVGEVLDLLKDASPARGRTLFHAARAANCVACHQLEGQGNVFAPDLADIAARAQPETIIRSILDPSEEITEGFASQTLETRDGEMHQGLVVGESARMITLADASGQTVDVLKATIVKRMGSNVSSMPASLADILSVAQVADIVAYLLDLPQAQIVGGKGSTQASSVVKATSVLTNEPVISPMSLHLLADGITVIMGDAPLARYYHVHPEVHRPFWAHVKTPQGLQVTRNFPPLEGLDPTDHGNMHPGLSMGFAVLNGVNFWHNREGRVMHRGYRDLEVAKGRVSFTSLQDYKDAGGEEICQEITKYVFLPNKDGYLMIWDTTFTADQAFYFGVKEEMGLALRVATPLGVKTGHGRILNAGGGVNEAGTWGKVDDWWDYAGLMSDQFVGIQLMSSPGNSQVWSHSRDYGVLVANPFPVDLKPNRGKRTLVEAGRPYRLLFGIQVHSHSREVDFIPAEAYRRFLDEVRSGP
ncbi:PmoA family protein [Verrucomicrobia bacterium]|nr:PmoA family protein [Verrucomicrobiota bacterium]